MQKIKKRGRTEALLIQVTWPGGQKIYYASLGLPASSLFLFSLSQQTLPEHLRCVNLSQALGRFQQVWPTRTLVQFTQTQAGEKGAVTGSRCWLGDVRLGLQVDLCSSCQQLLSTQTLKKTQNEHRVGDSSPSLKLGNHPNASVSLTPTPPPVIHSQLPPKSLL